MLIEAVVLLTAAWLTTLTLIAIMVPKTPTLLLASYPSSVWLYAQVLISSIGKSALGAKKANQMHTIQVILYYEVAGRSCIRVT